jgi:hypothetical protein
MKCCRYIGKVLLLLEQIFAAVVKASMHMCRMVLSVYSKLQQARKAGKPDYVVWNDHSVQLVRASKAHIDSFVVTNFISALKALTTSDSLNKVLLTLAQLHAVHRLVESSGEFLEVCHLTCAVLLTRSRFEC